MASSHPNRSAHGSDDEPPRRRALRRPVFSAILLDSVLLQLLWGAEGAAELDVALIQGELLSFEVGFLVQHPPGRKAFSLQSFRARLRRSCPF